MNDFATNLTALLDDVAAGIEPTPDFDAVLAGRVEVVPGGPPPGGPRPFRRAIAIAAASAVVLGGVAAAYRRSGDDPDLVATSSSRTGSTTTEVTSTTSPPGERTTIGGALAVDVEYSAVLGEASLDPTEQVVTGTAAPGEPVTASTPHGDARAVADEVGNWRLLLRLDDAPPATKVPVRVTFEHSGKVIELVVERPAAVPGTTAVPATTVPPETTAPATTSPTETTIAEREPPPTPLPFTAFLGGGDPSASPMKQVLYGQATPGSTILATSAYGHATAVAGPKGGWELVLEMYEVPAPSGVRITLTADTGGPEYEFWVERPAPSTDPKPVPFTADLAGTKVDGDLFKVVLYGTGRPGSGVRASSEFGVVEAVVSERGKWELALKLWEVPPGELVGIRVTNGASDAVYEFGVRRPESAPTTVDFTAQAALTESDRTPPVNEYWGTSTAGATIKLSSPYGGTQVTSDADGTWAARIEFPEAPVGTTFVVVVTSSKGEAVYEFPFTRIA